MSHYYAQHNCRYLIVMSQPAIKILIADSDNGLGRQVREFLIQNGFDAKYCRTLIEAREEIRDWKPRIVLADMIMSDGSGLTLLDYIKNQNIHLLMTSSHNYMTNIQVAVEKGASDYVIKPYKFENLLRRIFFHCRNYRRLEQSAGTPAREQTISDEASFMLQLTNLVLRQALEPVPMEDILFNLSRMVALKVNGVRCSVMECVDQEYGVVVTSNDDKSVSGLMLDLNKYPEVQTVMNTGKVLAVENIDLSPELQQIKGFLKNVSFNSIIVCPVFRQMKPFGVLSLRMPPERTNISDNEIRFVEIVGKIVSLCLDRGASLGQPEYWKKPSSSNIIPITASNSGKK